MVGVSAWYGNRKRATAIVIVGIGCLSVEFVLFIGSYGATPASFNLSRAYLITFPEVMIVRGALTLLALVVFLICMIISLPRRCLDPEETDVRRVKILKINAMRVYSWIPLVVALPVGIVMSLAQTDVLRPQVGTRLSQATRLIFFIPSSTCSISDLDQAVALLAGILTLTFSLYGSIRPCCC
jgi:hypothetical protein